MRLDHDTSYKQLFAHPELVCALLALCLPQRWVRRLQAKASERVNASYASDGGQQRHDDMVWHIQAPGSEDDWYLVLEFQAQPDSWMAQRLQVYIGLLYQDLSKQGRVPRNQPLPLVLPLVVYGGVAAWPPGVGRRLRPAGLRRYQRVQPYLLLDLVRHLAMVESGEPGNVVTALFECTHLGKARRLPSALASIASWLELYPGDSLRRTVTRWVTAHLRRRFKGITIASHSTLEEVRIMHGKQFETFIDALRYETLQEAKEQGLEQGMQSGRAMVLRDVLRRLLERQAGPLVQTAAAKIDAAAPELLQQWLDQVINGELPQQLLEAAVQAK